MRSRPGDGLPVVSRWRTFAVAVVAVLCGSMLLIASSPALTGTPAATAKKKKKKKCKKGQKRNKQGKCKKKKQPAPAPQPSRPGSLLVAGLILPDQPVYTGRSTTYTATVTNSSDSLGASGVILTISLPSATKAFGFPAGCSQAGADVDCFVGSLGPQQQAVRRISVVHQLARSYSSSVSARSFEGDSAASTTLTTSASDLLRSSGPTPFTIPRNTNLAFIWHLDNTGIVDSHGISRSTLLPAGVSFVSTNPAGACTATPVGGQESVTCNPVPTLLAGGSDLLTITLGFNQPGIFLTFGYSGVSAEGDPAFQPAVPIAVTP